MKAGKLTHVVVLTKSIHTETNNLGNPIIKEIILAKLRAEIVQQNTEEFIRDYGASDKRIMIFRTRFYDGVTNDCRVVFRGRTYNIKEITETGRYESLEIRCEELS